MYMYTNPRGEFATSGISGSWCVRLPYRTRAMERVIGPANRRELVSVAWD